MLKTYTLSGKIQDKRYTSCKWLISSEKINVFVKMQPFPKIGLFFAEFGYFLSEFGCSSFYLVTLLQSASIGHVHETSSRYIDLT